MFIQLGTVKNHVDVSIEVTAEDIANGVRHRTDCCPIAVAMLRAGMREVEVGRSWIEFLDLDGDCWVAKTPDPAWKFINAFDGGHNVTPLRLQLTAVKGTRRD